MCELKPYYSAQELIGLQLVILPTTKKAVIDKAKRENWQSRKRVGRGGGVEYALSSLLKRCKRKSEINLRPRLWRASLKSCQC